MKLSSGDLFADRLFAHLAHQAGLLQRKLTKSEWIRHTQEFYAQEHPVKVSARKRNELLDAIITACGGDPMECGKMRLKSAAVALADIKSVCPDLTIDEINSRASLYKSKHRDWPLTEMSLAKWWSHLGGGPRTKAENADIYMEPQHWRGILKIMYDLSEDGIRDKEWLDLGPDTRREILRKIHAK